MKKLLSVILSIVCLFAFCACGTAEEAQDEFLSEIQGSFIELFPELSKEEYHDAWVEAVEPLVGEDAAEDTIAYLLNVCMGSLYGEEAIAKYEADPESMQFNCYYIGGVAMMTVEGNTITGVDADGNVVFSHSYSPVDLENENGFLFYQSADADAGQFTYFAFSPDTILAHHTPFPNFLQISFPQSLLFFFVLYIEVYLIAEVPLFPENAPSAVNRLCFHGRNQYNQATLFPAFLV